MGTGKKKQPETILTASLLRKDEVRKSLFNYVNRQKVR